MNSLWNRLTMSQQRDLQDMIRWGLLFGGVIALAYGVIHWDMRIAFPANAWICLWWAAQLIPRKREGSDRHSLSHKP